MLPTHIVFTFAKAIYAKNIIFETSGIAKVGEDCFISVFIKDETNLNIKELNLNIFSTDINEKLLGRSNIIFTKLPKASLNSEFRKITINNIGRIVSGQ